MKLKKLKTFQALLAGFLLIFAASCSTNPEVEGAPLYGTYTAGPATLAAIADIAAAMEYGSYSSETMQIDDAALNFDTSGNFTLTIGYTYGEAVGAAAASYKIIVEGSYSVDKDSNITLEPLTLTDSRFFGDAMDAETHDNVAALFALLENAEITIEDNLITATLADDDGGYEFTFGK